MAKSIIRSSIVHGCCLSTKSWQTTPDGRMGWDEYFVRQGFDTYMIDQVGRARSGFDATKYNMVRDGVTPCVQRIACRNTPDPDRHRPVRLERLPLGNHSLHGFAMLNHRHTSSGYSVPNEHRRCGCRVEPAILQHGHP